jgi:hypothetical protein
MLLFAAATKGYWLTRSRLWESLALILVAFTLFRPGFWWDEIYAPTETLPATAIVERAAQAGPDGNLQMLVEGENLDGKFISRTVLLPLGEGEGGAERLRAAGLELRTEDERVFVDNVMFGSPAEQVGIDFDWEIVSLQVEAERPPKQLMFIPALALLVLVAWMQRRRAGPAQPAVRTA